MKLAVLFSGGKDSTLALLKALEKQEVVCLISMLSSNPESYMFHTPNVDLTRLQAEAMGLPLVEKRTEGKGEAELHDLRNAIDYTKGQYGAEGIVTGAIESVYQTERIQRICHSLDFWCFNPLWKRDQHELLKEIVDRCFKVIITGVFAYPLDKCWLGKQIDEELVDELVRFQVEYGISPSGEGGEIETTVLDCPLFKKRIEVLESEVKANANSGVYAIKRARLVLK